MINGLLCEKWRLEQEIDGKLNKYTFWIRYKVIVTLHNFCQFNKHHYIKLF